MTGIQKRKIEGNKIKIDLFPIGGIMLKLDILENFAKLEKMKNEGGIGSDMCYYSL